MSDGPWFDWARVPIWKVLIGAPSATGGPPGLTVRALIDSGSTHSFAVKTVFDKIEVGPTTSSITHYSAGSEVGLTSPNHIVDVGLPFTDGGELLMLRSIPVSEGILSFPPGPTLYHFVIGMDILTHCSFVVDGPRRRFRLERAR